MQTTPGPPAPPPRREPPPIPFDRLPEKPRKKRILFWIIIAAAGVFAMVGLIVGAGALYLLTGQEKPMSAAERKLMLDVETLANHLEDFTPNLDHEMARKVRYLDRSFELEYEFDDPDDEDAPFISHTITFERRTSDALAQYWVVWPAITAGIKLAADTTVTFEERNDLFKWGDRSRFAVIKSDGTPFGNLFVAHRGKVLVCLTLSGAYFEDAGYIKEFLTPALDRLKRFRRR